MSRKAESPGEILAEFEQTGVGPVTGRFEIAIAEGALQIADICDRNQQCSRRVPLQMSRLLALQLDVQAGVPVEED